MNGKKPEIVVVGVGSIGERHLRCFQSTGRAELSIVELNETLRKTVADRYGITRVYSSLDQAIEAGVNAAIVATPAQTHIPISTKLAEAGINLLIEKPFSTTLDGIDRLIQIVKEKNLVAGIAYVYRVHPVLTQMRDALLTGRFGKPVQLIAICGQNFPTYRPAYRNTYYTNHASGGGAIQDALTHIINAGEWLVGPTTRLVADAEHKVLEGVDVEDTVNVLTRHGGDVMGSYTLNQHQAPNEIVFRVICERGTLQWDMYQGNWRWMTEPASAWNEEPKVELERDTWFIAQATAYLDALEHKRPVSCSLEAGLHTLKVNLAILKALHETTGWQPIN